jgi:hypothetical protein
MNPVYRNTRSGSALLSMRNSQVSKWAGPGLKYLEGERETAMRREWWGRDRERERESDAQGVVREGQRERERDSDAQGVVRERERERAMRREWGEGMRTQRATSGTATGRYLQHNETR